MQKFAQEYGNTLNKASGNVLDVAQSLVQIVADNIRRAYAASEFTSERQLADKAGVAPNTLRAVMEPEIRAPNKRGEVSPRLDVLEKIARALGCDAWQLMSANFEPKDPPRRVLRKSEAEFYDRIVRAYRDLPPDSIQEPE